MDESVEKLAENARNLEIHDKSTKNWCDLPVELKTEVVKYVDFKSSLRLRQTALLERVLVDSRKFDFSKIELRSTRIGYGSLEIWSSRKNRTRQLIFRCEKYDCMRDLPPLMTHILKVGNISKLGFDSCASFMEAFLKNVDSIRIKKVRIFNSFPVDSMVHLLSKCPDTLESVFIQHHINEDYFPLRLLEYKSSDLAKISNTKILDYRFMDSHMDSNSFSEIVTAFASRQNTLGTTVNLHMATEKAILNLPPISIPRRVQSGDRISTSDPNIEILFEVSDAFLGILMHFVPPEPRINIFEI